jgi:hypothetical protein
MMNRQREVARPLQSDWIKVLQTLNWKIAHSCFKQRVVRFVTVICKYFDELTFAI